MPYIPLTGPYKDSEFVLGGKRRRGGIILIPRKPSMKNAGKKSSKSGSGNGNEQYISIFGQAAKGGRQTASAGGRTTGRVARSIVKAGGRGKNSKTGGGKSGVVRVNCLQGRGTAMMPPCLGGKRRKDKSLGGRKAAGTKTGGKESRVMINEAKNTMFYYAPTGIAKTTAMLGGAYTLSKRKNAIWDQKKSTNTRDGSLYILGGRKAVGARSVLVPKLNTW